MVVAVVAWYVVVVVLWVANVVVTRDERCWFGFDSLLCFLLLMLLLLSCLMFGWWIRQSVPNGRAAASWLLLVKLGARYWFCVE